MPHVEVRLESTRRFCLSFVRPTASKSWDERNGLPSPAAPLIGSIL
jgi:hypothetical protein